MGRSIGAVFAFVTVPTLVLIIAAHLGLFSHGSQAGAYGILCLAWLAGIAAIRLARWPRKITAGIMDFYTVIAVPSLPVAGLLAVSSTGYCL